GFPVDQGKVFGAAALPLERQQEQATAQANATLKSVDDQGTFGRIGMGMTAGEIRDAVSRRLDDRAVDAAKLDYLRTAGLPEQEKVMGRAQEAYDGDPTSERAGRNLAAAEQEVARLLDQMDRLDLKLDTVRAGYVQFGAAVRDSLESNVGKGIADLIEGTGTLRDAMLGFARDVVQAFSQMASRNLIQGLIGDAGRVQGNGTSGSLGGLAGGLASAIGSIFTAADGGVISGELRAFAAGGIVSEPTLALVGERSDKVAEAVVPLLGAGGTIPLGSDPAGGVFARLPGGRRVSATFDQDDRSHAAAMYVAGARMLRFAEGGVVGGGLGLDMPVTAGVPADLAGGWTPPVTGPGSGRQASSIGGEGGGGWNGNLYVLSDPSAMFKAGLRKNKDVVIDVVAGSALSGGKVRHALNRERR
ncbi:MAG: hypothetical protein JWO31_104, partial [Phycisphaerales bacterium]|nr:hypothetical protein [Phycisphaerales bacterium]